MKLKPVIILLICSVSCLAILTGLYFLSPLKNDVYRASFDRVFAKEPVIKVTHLMDLGFNSFYIAGATVDKIFLGNATSPFKVVSIDTALSKKEVLNIEVTKLDSVLDPKRFQLKIDSPYFFLGNGAMPEMLRGKIEDWKANRFLSGTNCYFVDWVPVSSTSFAFKSFSREKGEFDLAKRSKGSPEFQFNFNLLTRQIDGIFDVDGKLLFNRELQRVVYVYNYRNEIIIADSNLNEISRLHTLDSFKRAQIKVTKIGNSGQSMLASPPVIINSKCCTSGSKIYIQSTLLAKNESLLNYSQGVAIDVFSIETGRYNYSFYIPKYMDMVPNDFLIFKNKLAVLYGKYLLLYDFHPTLLSTG